MKKFFLPGIIIAATLGLHSCSPKYYAPNSQNVPLFTEQHELLVTGATDGNRGELQGAFAVTDHIGIIAGGSVFFPKDEDNGNGGKGSIFEAGAGYFLPLQHGLVFETYAIAGFGSVENHFPSSVQDYPGTDGTLKANVFRLALQPSFGYKSKYFEAALSMRTGLVNYSNITGDLMTGNTNQQQYLKDNNSQFLLEPALTLRGGYDFLKLQVQIGGSVNMTNSDFPQDNSWFTVGLNYRLHK